jgi:energy-coupling factor transporter ATP-binding protein EcfA2
MEEAQNNLTDFGSAKSKSPRATGQEVTYDESQDDYVTPSEAKETKTKHVSKWTEAAPKTFISTSDTITKLPPAVYKYVRFHNDKFAFARQPIHVDELLVMPDSLSDTILKDIETFLNRSDIYKHYNFLHRRGFMFYGPHGSGKSSLVQQILKQVIDKDGIVLLCENPSFLELGLADLRNVEKDRFVVCLFEDIDALIERYGEKEILAVLDGESQITKVLNIATTNYPELLDPRIVGRPRRFDRVIKIGWPSNEMRKHYFKHKLKIEDSEIDTWVKATERFSFAACAELVISVKCLGKDFNETIKVLRSLMDDKPSSNDYNIKESNLGFGNR